MITLFCNEEQKKEEEFFGSFLVSLFSLFSLASRALAESVFSCFSCFCVAPLFMHFSLSFILFGNHHQDNSSLLFVLSRVYTLHTLY